MSHVLPFSVSEQRRSLTGCTAEQTDLVRYPGVPISSFSIEDAKNALIQSQR